MHFVAVDLSQGVTLETKNVGGKAIQGYWRNTNRTDYTQPGLSTMDGKYTEVGHTIVALQFIPFGYKVQAQSNGGGWDAANTTLNAFGFASGIKETIIEGGAALNRGINISKVNDVSLLRTYGASGAKYLKISKGLEIAGSIVTTGYSTGQAINQYNKGGLGEVFSHRDFLDAGVGGIGLGAAGLAYFGLISNPVGWGIGIGVLIYGGTTLIYDAATSKP